MAAATDRIVSAESVAADGTRVPPLRRLQAVVRDDKALAEFLDWSGSPFGRLAVGALRDLALWGPVSTEEADVSVQYGVTVGLSLAARLLEDPSAVMPQDRKPVQSPSMDFQVSANDALDAM